MKILNQLNYKIMLAGLLVLLGISCSDRDDMGISSQTANITVRLTDAPGDYDAVKVEIIDVLVNYKEENNEDGWESIGNINEGVYDLLELTGGISVVLAENQVPAGKISQIRLLLGENNSIVIDGEEQSLSTPSGQQSGLKLKVNETLEAGYTYDFLLDFNVEKSIVVSGNSGNINLKPVINVSTLATSGIITGSVVPANVPVLASLVAGAIEIDTYTNENGVFSLQGVPEGVYDVVLTPSEASGYAPVVIEEVEVTNGETTSVGELTLELIPDAGNITGKITNEGVLVTATLEVEGEVKSAITDENGEFIFYNIPVNTYSVLLTPEEESNLSAQTLENVIVEEGQTTHIGDITLE